MMKWNKQGLQRFYLLALLVFANSCQKGQITEQGFTGNTQSDYSNIILNLNKDDLSQLDFEEIIGKYENVKVVLNDTLSFNFDGLSADVVDDPNADVDYTTTDGKGSIVMDSGQQIYFLWDDPEQGGKYYGSIHTKKETAQAESKYVRDFTGKGSAIRKLMDCGPYAVIEHIQRNRNMEDSNRSGVSPACNEVTMPSLGLKQLEQKAFSNKQRRKIRVRVYTYKKALNDRDINYNMIYTRKALRTVSKHAMKHISTYFNASKFGRKIIYGDFDKSIEGQFLWDWFHYAWYELSAYRKPTELQLLLTDFSLPGKAGQAILGDNFAWANSSYSDLEAPAHEVGHMFGAVHTGTYYVFPFCRRDVMNPGYWRHFCLLDTKFREGNIKKIKKRVKETIGVEL